ESLEQKRFLFFRGGIKGFQQPAPHPLLPFRQHVELCGIAGFLQDPAAFVIFRHREQDRPEAIGHRRGHIFSDGDEVAREPFRLRQNADLRSCLVVELGVVVVAKGSSRRLFCQNQIDELLLRRGKDITNLSRRNVRVQSALLRKFETVPREEELRQKVAGRRFGILENDDLTSKVVQAVYATVSFHKNEALIFRLASLPTPQEQLPGSLYVVDDIRRV